MARGTGGAATGSPIGDCLRAFATLRPTDAALRIAIAAALGLRTATAPAAAGAAAAPTSDLDDEPDPDQPFDPAPASRVVGSDDALPAVRPATLDAIDDDAEGPPDWLQDVALVPTPARVADPFRGERAALFDPKWQRAIVTRLASTSQPSGTLDLDAVVAHIAAARPIVRVPRKRIATAVKGVRLLVDRSESMQPFQLDVRDLVRAFRRTIGPARLRVESFQALPTWGVMHGIDAGTFRPDSGAMAVVVVSDLALAPQAEMSPRVDLDDWDRFVARQGRVAVRPTLVVPRSAAAVPASLSRHARVVSWDRRTRVSRLDHPAPSDDPRDAGYDATAGVDGDAATMRRLATIDASVHDLATACALASRIEPSLLRELRLAIAPAAGVAAEAELWFSGLVAERAATGLVFAAAPREGLLRRLRASPALLERAWILVAEAHVTAPPAVRLEEEATWRWLRGDVDGARDILRTMVATVVAPQRGDAWRWATQAVARLPRDLMAIDEGRMLALGTAVRGGASAAIPHGGTAGRGNWRWLRPATHDIELAVTLRAGAIEFAPRGPQATSTMRVPDVNPVVIDVVPGDPHARAERVRVDPRRRTLVTIAGDRFELQVLGGDRYRLRQVQDPPPGGDQRFVRADTAPRVELYYAVEWYGAQSRVELPFVVGVMADVSGRRGTPLPPVVDRKFAEIDVDNFDARMASLRPRVVFEVDDTLTGEGALAIDLAFDRLGDFAPGAVVARIAPLAALLATRSRLHDLSSRLEVRDVDDLVLDALPLLGSRFDPASDVVARDRRLTALRRGLGNPPDEPWRAVVEGLGIAARNLDASPRLVGHDAFESLRNVVADIDARLSAQLDPILHHPDFQRLEGTWRGLWFLVAKTKTGPNLKIRLLDITKRELARALAGAAGEDAGGASPFPQIEAVEFDVVGGQPYGCLIGDYAFDHSPGDVSILAGMARVAASAQAPFLAGVAPSLLELDTWQRLGQPRDIARILDLPDHAAWRALRDTDDARWIALAMPRFLARRPYGTQGEPIEEFAFDEDLGDGAGDRFTWANAAYALGTNITHAFATYGWCARIRGIESGGAVTGLPTHRFAFDDDGDPAIDCSTEVAVTDRREYELARAGLMALMHRRDTDIAFFASAQTLMRPQAYAEAGATASASLSARLPFLFAIARFAHYVRCIARDRIGSFADADALRAHLQAWLRQYVDADPEHSSESIKAAHPLAAADVTVEATPSASTAYRATLMLRPHYQLEGLTTSLRVVTVLLGSTPPVPPNAA